MDKPSSKASDPDGMGARLSNQLISEIVTPVAGGLTPRRRRHDKIPPVVQKLTMFGGLAAYFGAMAVVSWVFLMGRDLPDATRLWERTRPVSVQFVDRQGRDLMTRGAHEASPVSVETLPPHLVQAVLAIEDRRFYDHIGIDPYSLARAVVKNLKNRGYSEGASTLTQQLAKNVFLKNDKTIARKVKEAILALWLERDFTKDELLEMYLERVYFGAGTWGIDAAARSYFGKPVTELNIPCLLYTSPSPRDQRGSRMPSSA